MNREFISLIGFDEKKTLLYYVPLFILRIVSFKLFAKKLRMMSTEWMNNIDTDDIKLR